MQDIGESPCSFALHISKPPRTRKTKKMPSIPTWICWKSCLKREAGQELSGARGVHPLALSWEVSREFSRTSFPPLCPQSQGRTAPGGQGAIQPGAQQGPALRLPAPPEGEVSEQGWACSRHQPERQKTCQLWTTNRANLCNTAGEKVLFFPGLKQNIITDLRTGWKPHRWENPLPTQHLYLPTIFFN